MPVKPRGDSFEATVHHKGERYRKSFPLKVQAEAWMLQTQADLKQGKILTDANQGSNTEAGPRNLIELRDLTYRKYWKDTPSASSAMQNADKCINIIGREVHPTQITMTVIDNLIFMLEAEGLASGTINRKLSALSRMLTYAYDRGFINRVPKIERKQEPESRMRFVSDAEEAEMLAFYQFIGNFEMADLVVVGLDTGMRLSEIRRLRPATIDFTTGMVFVDKSKNGRSRHIPMTSRVREVLLRKVKATESLTEALWKGWTNKKILYAWNTAKSHLKLMQEQQFVPHSMRHTFCSRLVQRGVDIVSVSKLAGHQSITTTMRYVHLVPQNLIDAVKMLNPETEEELVPSD